MAETTSDDAASARAAEQARLRKERRQAKIRAGGAARLNQITGLGGGVQREEPPPSTSPSPPPAKSAQPTITTASEPTRTRQQRQSEHDDPEEVDISLHDFTNPRTAASSTANATGVPESRLREMMMLGLDRPGAANPGLGPGLGPDDGADADPMANLLKQMMANGPGGPGLGSDPAGPFAGANPFAFPQQQQEQGAAVPDRYSSLWRLIHTAVALGLGLYIALWTSFSGSKLERDENSGAATASGAGRVARAVGGEGEAEGAPDPRFFFWAFATAETVLLTTRFFLDRARAPPGGLLWSAASFLPAPFGGYLKVGLRYAQVLGTVRSDILVCIFVLGVCSWFRAI